MSHDAVPEPEVTRLLAVARYSDLDAATLASLNRLTALVAGVLKVPTALVNFVDRRQWCGAGVGTGPDEVPLEQSLCARAISSTETMVTADARQDVQFADNPAVLGEPHIRFYAAAPLITPQGHAIGTLCITDQQPRCLKPPEQAMLEAFAAQAMELLELRVRSLELEGKLQAGTAQLAELRREVGHAETLLAITALFDRDLDPATATEASAALLSRVIDVDWAGLLMLHGEEVRLLAAWERPQSQAELKLPKRLGLRSQGVLASALRRQQAAFVDDYSAHLQARPELLAAGVESLALLPLGDDQGIQYVLLAMRSQRRVWHPRDRALCEAAARSIRSALERQARIKALEVAATTDTLTELPNRRAFNQALETHWHSVLPYSVLMFDLDGMKQINDREGHARGDVLLRTFGLALQAQLASVASVYRLGGDEFAVLWPGTPDGGEIAARVEAAERSVQTAGFARVEISAGAAASAEAGGDIHQLVRLADARMYEDKRRRKLALKHLAS